MRGESQLGSDFTIGWRMTGSAFKAMDVVVACVSVKKGGGLEEGGLEIDPDRREADDGKRLSGDGRCSGVCFC